MLSEKEVSQLEKEDLQRVSNNKPALAEMLDALAQYATLEQLHSLGPIWKTLIQRRMVGIEEGTDDLYRMFHLAWTKDGTTRYNKQEKEKPGSFRVRMAKKEFQGWKGSRSFAAKQAIYLFDSYGPYGEDPNRRGFLVEVAEED